MSYTYHPLEQHIARSPASQLRMSYAEIETVLGRSLPPSTRNEKVKRQWWANTDTHTQAKAWLSNGRKAKLDVRTDTVTFYKTDDRHSDHLKAARDRDEIVIPFTALQPAAVRLIDDFMDERSVDRPTALAALLNEAATRHRREALSWFAANTKPSSVSSADLIRAERDGR